jgi:uncharacterized membrane protein
MRGDDDLARRFAELEERVRRLESVGAGDRGRENVEHPGDEALSPEAPELVLPQAEEEVATAAVSTPSPNAWPADSPPPPATEPRARRNLEAVIGGSVLNRIGIAAVLIGSAYFLRHAFEHEWIGPTMRVSIGMVLGIVLLVWAERLRRKEARIFAYSVDVIGVGVLYLSIWSASQLYALVPTTVAFAGMVVVTAATVALALRHDSEFLAALAMTTGFLTPVLLASVEGRTIELFSYVLLLDVAALVLLALRPWVLLFVVNFAGTLFLYTGWHVTTYSPDELNVALGFTTAFFVVFAKVSLVRRWSSIPVLQLAILVLLPLANAFVYFTQLSLLFRDQRPLLVTSTAALGVIFIVLFGLFRARHRASGSQSLRSLADLHLGIGLGFLLLTIPLHFDGTAITLAWLVAAAVLFSIHARLRHPVLATAASIALGVAVLRLVFIDEFHAGMVLINLRAFSFMLAIALFAWLGYMAREQHQRPLRNMAIFAANALAIIALTREANDLFAGRALARDFAWSSIWMSYAAGLMVAGFRRSSSFVRWLGLGLLGFTVLKVFFYDLAELEAIYRIMSFIALGVILLAVSFVYQRLWLEPGR